MPIMRFTACQARAKALSSLHLSPTRSILLFSASTHVTKRKCPLVHPVEQPFTRVRTGYYANAEYVRMVNMSMEELHARIARHDLPQHFTQASD